MSNLDEKYQVQHLKDDTYQLINRYTGDVEEQGSYSELVSYIQLEEWGLL